ncbi:DNase I-like protein, partial [Trametopsis cervina]
RTTAVLRLASLNMKGHGPSTAGPASDKWLKINQIVREMRTAVLALQETHLDDNHVETLHELFGKRIHVFHSPLPNRANTAAGVAFVLNKERVDVSQAEVLELIPGRALLLTLRWHQTVSIRILNVYAPNSATENAHFWTTLQHLFEDDAAPKPDVILGDFNIVEDPLDRLPVRPDNAPAARALADLHTYLDLEDTWREQHPSTRAYTYIQDHGTALSRLDRIYLSQKWAREAADWLINDIAGIPSDHMMVAVSLSDKDVPYVGTGRWVVPKAVLADYQFTAYVKQQGNRLLSDIPDPAHRTAQYNAQTLYQEFKANILSDARKRAKVNIPKLIRRIAKLKTARATMLNTPEPRDEGYISTEAAVLQQRIKDLETRRFGTARKTVALNDWIFGEKINKPWIATNKPKAP